MTKFCLQHKLFCKLGIPDEKKKSEDHKKKSDLKIKLNLFI